MVWCATVICAASLAEAKPTAEARLLEALSRCVAFMTEGVDTPITIFETNAGHLTLFPERDETGPVQCKIIGAELPKEWATVTWPAGADIVEAWMADQPGMSRAALKGWTLPIEPVLGCGAVSVIAQPLRVFGADAAFSDMAPNDRPIEITLPAPERLCDKYGAVMLEEITHA